MEIKQEVETRYGNIPVGTISESIIPESESNIKVDNNPREDIGNKTLYNRLRDYMIFRRERDNELRQREKERKDEIERRKEMEAAERIRLEEIAIQKMIESARAYPSYQ